MQRQLTFDLAMRPALGRGDFMVSSSNAAALTAIDSDWPQGKLVLTGPRGSGKSHLARVWAAEHQALLLSGRDLAQADLGQIDPLAVVVDDADAVVGNPVAGNPVAGNPVAGNPVAEQALFHLHNLVMAAGGKLLLTAAAAPARWPITLADLASRLSAAATATLEPPDDLLLSALLVKLFADRQLRVPLSLIPYLVARMDRSFAAAGALVAALDARALTEGRAITRGLAAQVLDSVPQTRP